MVQRSKCVVNQRVLDIDNHARRRVHARHLLDRQNGFEEFSTTASVLLGNLDPHQTKLKELANQVFFEYTLFVHLFRQRTDFLFGKLMNVIAEENFVFRKCG